MLIIEIEHAKDAFYLLIGLEILNKDSEEGKGTTFTISLPAN